MGGDPAGGNLISVCFFFYGRCDALGDARRDARDALGDACFSERERALAVVIGLASAITPHPLGGGRDRLGELGGSGPLALGPIREVAVFDHPADLLKSLEERSDKLDRLFEPPGKLFEIDIRG